MLPRRRLVVAVLLLLLYATSAQEQQRQPLSRQDRVALNGLRASLGVRASDWPLKADPCAAWAGVVCRAGRVAELRLGALRRTRAGARSAGFAVDALRGLTALEAFNASGFPLPGRIPAWFGRGLQLSLAVLDLRSADVSGELPGDLGMSGNLTTLVLAGNSLSGRIPASLFSIKGLRFLDLSNNNLTGELPNVSGELPGDLGMSGNLTTLVLAGNSLSGRIPASLFSIKGLRFLDLSNNNLTGELPNVSGELPGDLGMSGNLTTLVLAGNSLSGRIPASLFSIKGLRFLDLSNNNLTGELPNVSVSAGDGAGVLFNASGNSLYGAIGDGLGALRKRFWVVDLSNNYFDQVSGNGFGNGSGGTVDIKMNCLFGVPSQRSGGYCEAFYKRNGAQSPVPPKALPSPGKKGVKWKYVLAGVLGATAIVVVLFLVALVFCLTRRGRRRPRGRGVEQNEEGIRSGRRSSSVNPVMLSPMAASLVANGAPKSLPTIVDDFTYEQLHLVTGGFGDDNLVKHGRSGDIYRGVWESGFNVVIKKIDLKSSKKNMGELHFLAKNSHGRIVPLLGHLAKDEEELLVYKYMVKGDLTTALHKKPVDAEEGLHSLDWITRLKIAIGVAEALCFLHDECSPPLVHRDIQASSVLLDDKFEVRLGSLSEICTQQSEGSQSFLSRMLRSSKSLDKNTSGPPASCSYDVYCFGKVLLELITGNFGVSGSNDTVSEEWLASTLGYIDAHDKESVSNIVDPSLVVDEDHLEEVWAVSIVAKTCLNPKPSRRPLARYILKALENPPRVVREELCSNSSRLRSTSSRSSWRSALHGHSYQVREVMPKSGQALARKHSVKSEGSDGEENLFSFKRASREIFPDPV